MSNETTELQLASEQNTTGVKAQLFIGTGEMIFHAYSVKDPIVLGRQILQTGGYKPVSEHLVFQLHKDGELEEIGLDQEVDLRDAGDKFFVVFRSDRSYRFELDETRFEWGAAEISGAALKTLARVDVTAYGVWKEMKDCADQEIGNIEYADLTGDGIERFFTAPKIIVVEVNKLPVTIHSQTATGLQIKELAIQQHVQIQLSYQLLQKIPGHPSKVIGDDEVVTLHKGMVFHAIPADDNS